MQIFKIKESGLNPFTQVNDFYRRWNCKVHRRSAVLIPLLRSMIFTDYGIGSFYGSIRKVLIPLLRSMIFTLSTLQKFFFN